MLIYAQCTLPTYLKNVPFSTTSYPSIGILVQFKFCAKVVRCWYLVELIEVIVL